MSDRQRRISGLAFMAGVLAGLLLIGVGYGARASTGGPNGSAASIAQSSP